MATIPCILPDSHPLVSRNRPPIGEDLSIVQGLVVLELRHLLPLAPSRSCNTKTCKPLCASKKRVSLIPPVSAIGHVLVELASRMPEGKRNDIGLG